MVFDDLVPDFVPRHHGVPKFGWAQVDLVPLPPAVARDMIADLENTDYLNTLKVIMNNRCG